MESGAVVLVGFRMDGDGKELLTWALVKAAAAGDRVVALHVLPSGDAQTSGSSEPCAGISSSLSLVQTFDSVLASYQGFCDLKQVDLQLKVCRGSSARKTLVQQASTMAADKLILGVNKGCFIIGASRSWVAKYCAKKLERTCLVMAVNNGKIVFESMKGIGKEIQQLTRSISVSPKESIKNLNRSRSLFLFSSAVGTGRRSNCMPAGSDRNSWANDNENCSICSESKNVKKPANVRRSVSVIIRESPEARTGWPLIGNPFLHYRKVPSVDRSKMSFGRSNSSSIHPDCKTLGAESNVLSSLDEGNKVVSLGTDLSSLSVPDNVDVDTLPKELQSLQEKYSSIRRLFSYKELTQATSNFSSENLIGKGGSSCVYKGCLSNGKELAVKVLKSSEVATKEIALEIEIITSIHHKNIVQFYGFCFGNNKILLVYDFLPRGSLENNLHGGDYGRNLNWAARYNVAMGVAKALDYLHGTGISKSVIHKDVKCSNILLSDEFEPQLSDFGLAQWASEASSNMTYNDVAGTFGYLAPEYLMYGKASEKVDVYAFGVVLLELISGRKPISAESSKGDESLVMWAKSILNSGMFQQLVDPCLADQYDHDQMERLILAASICIGQTPHSRPQISDVLLLLQGDENILRRARMQPIHSEKSETMAYESAHLHDNIKSHIELALLDMDDSLSIISAQALQWQRLLEREAESAYRASTNHMMRGCR